MFVSVGVTQVLSPLKNVEDEAVPEPSLAFASVPAVSLLVFKLGISAASNEILALSIVPVNFVAAKSAILASGKVPEVNLSVERLGI